MKTKSNWKKGYSGGYKKYSKPEIEKVFVDPADIAAKMTEYHRIIQSSIKSGVNSTIKSGPGTGKTWTVANVVIPALENAGKTKGMVFAFTNKNADDFKRVIHSPEIETGTYHALLGRIVVNQLNSRRNLPSKFNKNEVGKTMEIARELFPDTEKKDLAKFCDLADKAKMAAFGIGNNPAIANREAWQELMDRFSINGQDTDFEEDSDCPDIIEAAQKIMVESIKLKREIDFADMPYFVLYYDLKIPDLDFVIMDEAQDIPQILLEFLAKCHGKGIQIIAVGDENQSINKFAGAIDFALDAILDRTGGESLNLKVSYRVSRAAAQLCNEIFPDSVIPWNDAKDGSIENIGFDEFSALVPEFSANDVALSRTHKNLIPFAMEFIREGREFVYKGIREWVAKARKSLYMASRKANSTEFFAITIAMDDFLREKEEANSQRAKMPNWLIELAETTNILNELIQGIQKIGGDYKVLMQYLDKLEAADNNSKGLPTLSTIHASKGGEWPNVYIIGDCISPLAKSESEKLAEQCTQYVAYSRSSDKLIFVPAGK